VVLEVILALNFAVFSPLCQDHITEGAAPDEIVEEEGEDQIYVTH
jgi:hypothetical protein